MGEPSCFLWKYEETNFLTVLSLISGVTLREKGKVCKRMYYIWGCGEFIKRQALVKQNCSRSV